MLIFLYGQDTYRSREETRKIIEEYRKANSNWLDLIKIDVSDKNLEIFEDIYQSVNAVSMFSNKKLIIIENVFLPDQKTQEKILKLLEKKETEKNKDITIIFWAEEVDKKNKLFKFLEERAKVKEFNNLRGIQLRNWIKDFIQNQGGGIDNQALDKLIEYVGSDLWRITNEINKLISFKSQAPNSKSQTIKGEDIELLVRPEIDLNIFEMIDALGYKNKSKALSLFKKHLEKGEDEGYLLSMFIYQIRNLIKLKSGGRLDMHPFVIKKTRQQARNFSFEDLKKIYYQLLTIDFDIKTGRADSKVALELWVVNL